VLRGLRFPLLVGHAGGFFLHRGLCKRRTLAREAQAAEKEAERAAAGQPLLQVPDIKAEVHHKPVGQSWQAKQAKGVLLHHHG
jgi:hypothetical protein